MNENSDIIELSGGESVQESYDECDGEPVFVIADTARDGAWLSITGGGEIQVNELR